MIVMEKKIYQKTLSFKKLGLNIINYISIYYNYVYTIIMY